MRSFTQRFAFFSACALLVLLTLSCEKKESKVVFTSPEKTTKLTFKGTKAVPTDPFRVTVTIEAYGNSHEGYFEIYNSELSKEQITINWQGENQADIRIAEQDGTSRQFGVQVSETQIRFFDKNPE